MTLDWAVDRIGFVQDTCNALFTGSAAGLPVISSRVGGVEEAVVNGETGLLVERGDEAGLAERMQALKDDPMQRGRLGAAGYRRFDSLFRVERMCAETLEVYRALLPED